MTQENETHNIISDDGNDWIDKLRYSRSFMAKLIKRCVLRQGGAA